MTDLHPQLGVKWKAVETNRQHGLSRIACDAPLPFVCDVMRSDLADHVVALHNASLAAAGDAPPTPSVSINEWARMSRTPWTSDAPPAPVAAHHAWGFREGDGLLVCARCGKQNEGGKADVSTCPAGPSATSGEAGETLSERLSDMRHRRANFRALFDDEKQLLDEVAAALAASRPAPPTPGTPTTHKMHARDCGCEYCRAYVNVPWVELTLRVLCPKCSKFVLHTDRIHRGVHWNPSVYCPTCGFIEIPYVIAGEIGVTPAPEPAAPANAAPKHCPAPLGTLPGNDRGSGAALAGDRPTTGTAPQAQAAATDGLANEYLILSLKWSKGQNNYVWYRSEANGYTAIVDVAGRYSAEAAKREVFEGVTAMVPAANAVALSSRVVVQEKVSLKELFHASAAAPQAAGEQATAGAQPQEKP